jgi:transposase-like protein
MRLLRSHGGEPRKIVTDKLQSYGVAHRELMPDATPSTKQYEENGGPCWIRTSDQLVKSQLLYQLS